MARNLIPFSNLPISEISRAWGYEDPFYFSTRFRALHGLSPRKYRNMADAQGADFAPVEGGKR